METENKAKHIFGVIALVLLSICLLYLILPGTLVFDMKFDSDNGFEVAFEALILIVALLPPLGVYIVAIIYFIVNAIKKWDEKLLVANIVMMSINALIYLGMIGILMLPTVA